MGRSRVTANPSKHHLRARPSRASTRDMDQQGPAAGPKDRQLLEMASALKINLQVLISPSRRWQQQQHPTREFSYKTWTDLLAARLPDQGHYAGKSMDIRLRCRRDWRPLQSEWQGQRIPAWSESRSATGAGGGQRGKYFLPSMA